MKQIVFSAGLMVALTAGTRGLAQDPDLPGPGEKPRVVVLTDIENEPDDAQSMVRFLL